ncbi:MAG: GatB/YqeY domain-containing protein [Nitrospinota bacterium]|nr:GatB/YqeY domain-containing protein [Nitrospinota bacterium]
MNLKEKLLSDMKGALKARDSLRLSTIRGLNSEIKNKEIDLRRDILDEEVLSLVASQIKKRKEAAAMFEKGGRFDLSEKEDQERVILQGYLPEQASEDEVRNRVREVIAELAAQGPKDLGKVMKTIIPEFKGKADSGMIKNLVSEYLVN